MRKKGTIWIITGLLLLAAAFGYVIHNFYTDFQAGENASGICIQIEEEINEQIEDETEALGGNKDYLMFPDLSMPTEEIDGYRYIGTLEFPSLELRLPVMEEWDYTRLNIAPCLYYGSIYKNNAVICGHNYRTHFSPLKYADEGFEAIFTDMDGNRFEYTLSYKEVIKPTDTETMTKESNVWDLTLFTCTTGGQSRMALRFVLKNNKM